MTGPESVPFDAWMSEPEFGKRWWHVMRLLVDQLTDTERAEFELICRDETGTMKCWPIDDYWQFTVGNDDQLLLGTIHRGTFYADTNPRTLIDRHRQGGGVASRTSRDTRNTRLV
jgi:hypothetical protein